MRECFRVVSILACALGMGGAARAQYPKVPSDVRAATDKLANEAKRLSDEAWQQALSEINAWEAKGKPYIPWAAKPEDLPQAKIPAFPGAWGGGMYSFGGRDGRVLVVANLNDSGPGSFRWACEQGGPRIIVFNVAGIIRIKAPISIRAPYVTIAGNTAPGDGVCVAGNTVQIDTHDVILRYMRFRRGKTDAADRDDSLGGNGVGNIIIDHVSASWSLDENFSMYRHMYQPPQGGQALKLPTVNVTIQNSISSESLNTYNHAFGSTIGGLNSTFHHNLWACNTGRNPSVGMYGDFTFVNNVLFNWRHRTVDGGDQKSLFNIINNYLKPGPGTPNGDIAFRLLKPESERSKTVVDNFGKAYVSGNVVEGNERVTADNWAGGVQPEVQSKPLPDALAQIRVNEPFKHAPLQVQSAREAYDYVLDHAGATLPRRDAVDERIIGQVRTGKIPPRQMAKASIERAKFYGYQQNVIDDIDKLVPQGFVTDPNEVGGWPEYKGAPYQDSDGDGMPDAWEVKYGLDPNAPADAALDCSGDGYTNIEKYIYGIDPTKKIDWTDPKNNVDTLAARAGFWADVPLASPAADPQPAYTRTITGRAANIVKTLEIADPAKSIKVRDIIVQQYRNLNAIQNQRDKDVKASPQAAEDIRQRADALTRRVHQDCLAGLSAELTPEQVDQVKDGMTYGTLPTTYRAYLAQFPELTEAQKQQIMTLLVEARELALDGGSSEEKHAIFRKYKGKINNYLSAQGYKSK
jgi:hypothetical protein